jgi:hypothetical protein
MHTRVPLFIAAALAIAVPARAVPLTFNHHGRLLNADDSAVTGTADVTIRFHKQSTDPVGIDNLIWEETYTAVPVNNGFYSLVIGDTTAGDSLELDDWDGVEERWMGISINGGAEMTPRMRVGATPFALRAEDADALGGEPPSYYAAAAHTHTAAGVTDFATAVASAAQSSGNFAAATHTHPTTEVTGFAAAALTAAETSTRYALATHGHAAAEVTDFAAAVPPALAGATVPGAVTLNGPSSASNAGTLLLDSAAGGPQLRIGVNETDGYSWIQSHGSLPLRINELGNNVSITGTSSNVGIGTHTPGSKLHVAGKVTLGAPLAGSATPGTGGSNEPLRTLELIEEAATPSPGLRIAVKDTTNGYYGWVGSISAGAGGSGWGDKPFLFRTPGSGGTPMDTLTMQRGNVTIHGTEYWPARPAFSARGVNQPFTSAGEKLLDYTISGPYSFNNGNHFNDTTNLFTAPVNGLYWFSASCRFENANSTYYRLYLGVNNSGLDYSLPHSIEDFGSNWNPQYASMFISGVVKLDAGDTVKVYASANSDTSWQHQGEDRFSGFLLSAL